MGITANYVIGRCYELEKKGIKPSVLIAGQAQKAEITSTPYAHRDYPIKDHMLNTYAVGGYILHCVFIEKADHCEVYGNELIPASNVPE